jgi:hypothetical protein
VVTHFVTKLESGPVRTCQAAPVTAKERISSAQCLFKGPLAISKIWVVGIPRENCVPCFLFEDGSPISQVQNENSVLMLPA